ncbi:transcription-repair coupling factor [Roseivirga misakiensis]|uniref:Transcription-repair-coupling factor n=1 Tax=Roseivirga misakiensis TaxID=1563681 RepID=A0A1E5T716_9BACT|nr:transcription-repair coupling factor [Roseivirga misakiensis]OEK07097.1 transcription-repair coupling factor [Roseivirga misakiensis]
MKVKDFIKVYKEDALIQTIAERIKPNQSSRLRLKGLVGSLDAVVAAATYQLTKQTNVFVLHDKEEAAYFHNDLQNLMGEKEVLLFPTSYKRPYQFDETENANILMRAEILNRINHKASTGELVVTYPEALTEKVINKKALSSNTFSAKVGEQLDVAFLSDLLATYDFEKNDFVYEAGQFSVRGGIVDVYSYAHDLPYRIELFGNEIESIRTFDPVSQLSEDSIKEINIIPNVQTRLLEETRQSFPSFLPNNTKIWFKDYQQTLDTIDKYFAKATENFDEVLSVTDTQVVLSPSSLFENADSFISDIHGYAQVEFGSRNYMQPDFAFDFDVEAQQSFNKNFDKITENLGKWQLQNTMLCIAAESLNQINRLETIFLELDPTLKIQSLNIGLRQGFIDKTREVLCYTDHQLFDRFHKYKTKTKHSKSKALTLKELRSLQPGDYVTHIDHGVGRFVGMEKKEVNGKLQESIRLVYRDDDLLYVSLHALHKISKYTGKEGMAPSMSKLGSPEWENKKKRVKGKVKDIAKDLISLYSKRKNAPGFAFSQDGFLQAELESSFIYEDTPDQALATEHVKHDMELSHPMDRLVCGDVGFGKTEVAIRAAFKAAVNGKQVAVLVPTTILAMQHYRTFAERLSNFPIKVEYINRFKTAKEIRETLERVKEGKTEILIGTHRIVNKDVSFKDLGLLVIDEEQKFGVKVKDKLKEFRVNVDVLTLTATPIPRTLHFSLMGARDLSVIATPPPNRQPVTTEIHSFNEVIMRDAISFELRRGGQVFVVHNRINDIEQIGNIILKLVPDARIGIAHGQMDGSVLEKRMVKFIEGEYDVLVSTNIIESGLDIPNANTIIINHAHMFGLSDLHQMRGRVGRSNRKAFCYLLTPPTIGLTSEARKRLSALEEFSDLGDGFKVAMRDLDIRGAGNLLGAEQSGFISDLGFDMYHKILDEAVQELKENEFKSLFEKDLVKEAAKIVAQDCTIETDLEILIPDSYVSNISERLSLYSKLDSIKNEEKLQEFINNIQDRFGNLPTAVVDLVETVRLRWLAEQLGFEKVVLKNEAMKCYFLPSDNEAYFQSPTFGKILAFVQKRPKTSKMKEYKTRLILTFNEIKSVDEGKALLNQMLAP